MLDTSIFTKVGKEKIDEKLIFIVVHQTKIKTKYI